MNLTDRFQQEADDLYPQLVAWRRDFHQHPELGFQEVRTAGIVADHLHDLGLEMTTGIGKTGIVALVEPDDLPADAPTVMLRFDMDALPIEELTGLPFRSQNEGVMHACGHDGHTAIGMGVAQLLSRHRNELSGRVKLIFQPAEEGMGGAQSMIDGGALEDPKPSASFGLHLWSRLPLNQVIVQAGPLWASAGEFSLMVHGTGGHGATPHDTVDATLVAAQILINWQSIVSRYLNPSDPAVISIGQFHSGSAYNIISEHAKLVGTYRCYTPEVQALLLHHLETLAHNIAAAYGARAEFVHAGCVPAVINSEEGAALMQGVAEQIVGAEQITQITPMMVGEDMAQFLNRAPGCFVLVGASDPAEEMHSPHHSPTFDFDERMMPTGVALLASAASEYLAKALG